MSSQFCFLFWHKITTYGGGGGGGSGDCGGGF